MLIDAVFDGIGGSAGSQRRDRLRMVNFGIYRMGERFGILDGHRALTDLMQ